MGWAIGYDETWQRDIGYGVPAVCDHPRCNTQIDRGLAYVCGGQPFGGEWGCGLYFCTAHLFYAAPVEEPDNTMQCCEVCAFRLQYPDRSKPLFDAKRDIRTWIRWKLTHESWAGWRELHPDKVTEMRIRMGEVVVK